jgi:TonB-dependent starch-binding outer membrane protein SusC
MKNVGLLICFLFCMTTASWSQSRQIKGKVIEKATGSPLSEVSVMIKGTNTGTLTDKNGNFTITAPGTGKIDLEVSLISYGTQQVPVDGTSEVTISLDKEAKSMDEVVVVGYGAVRKRDLTGAVASVKGEEVKKVPASNVIESVQGKVAGVDIVRTSGGAGARPAVAIRGNRSINANNSPLYIVDGIQYDNFQDINANDIESMDVLKDASSTAIYGSRGANGVIIITTKKGSTGKARITANAYYGVSEAAGYPVPMTGPEYADLKRQAYRTIGTWNSPADDPKVFTSSSDLAAVRNGTSTYWPGYILQKGGQQDYGVGVAAGSDKTRVYFSFNYFKEKGLLNNDYSDRYTVRLNIDQALSSTFKVGLQSQLTYYNQNLRADGILNVANKVIPFFTPYNPDGTLAKFPGNGNQVNPLLQEEEGAYINKFNTTRILSTAYAEWKPVRGLMIRSNLGVTNSNTQNGSFEDANTISRALSTGSISRINNNKDVNILWENIISYQKRFDQHNIELTGVTSYLKNQSDSSMASGTGQLVAGQSYYALQNNPANLSVFSRYVENTLISGAFRINYSFKDRYLLTLTGRADGASQLAESNHWSFFPSVAAAWRLIDESFLHDQSFFNDLKLRASYGVAGNSAVRPYATQTGLVLVPYAWNDASALAYALDPQTGNPELNWELTSTFNLGLDASAFKSRITASFDYYESNTKDLLLLRQLPASSGASRILQNIGRTSNTGFEISLRTININSQSFRWNSLITYTRNKERIEELVGKQNDVVNKWFIGHPINSFYDYEKIGIWQTQDSALARSFGYKPGDIRVKEQNGDKTISAANDRIILGSTVPDYSFGFSNDFNFRNFDLNIYVFGRIGQMFVSDYANKFEPNAIENGARVNYWTPENPTNEYPRPNANISRAAMPFATTLGYKDGSFVKIRNITLGYTLPVSAAKKIGVNGIRFYVSAKNYITFAKVDDYDPEGSGSFERPLAKLIVGGLNFDF